MLRAMESGKKLYIYIYFLRAGRPFFAFFFLFEVYLIYNVVLVSGIQQNDPVIYIYIYINSFLDIFPL